MTKEEFQTQVINILDTYEGHLKTEIAAKISDLLSFTQNRIIYRLADLELNPDTFSVKRSGILIDLSPHEYKLLKYLLENKNRVVTREMILNRVWVMSPDTLTRVVDVYMGYLRNKIEKGFKTKLIHTKRGFGYMLSEYAGYTEEEA